MTKDEFIEDYVSWAAEKKYHQNRSKAAELYDLASDGISTLPANTPSTKMLVLEAVRVLSEIDRTLHIILSPMHELARTLKEYDVVIEAISKKEDKIGLYRKNNPYIKEMR